MKPFNGNYPVTFSYLRLYSNGKPHKGVDFGTPYGTTLVAAVSGTVWYAGNGGGWGPAYGGQVIIKTSVAGKTRYVLCAHMSSISVRTGQSIKIGTPIGRSGGVPGTTGAGNSTGAHVHFQVNPTTTWSNHINPQHILDIGLAQTVKPVVTPIPRAVTYRVNTKTLNVRDFPHTSFSRVVSTLSQGEVFTAKAEAKVSDQWWAQLPNGNWVAQDYLLAVAPVQNTDTTVYTVNVDLANLRERASINSRALSSLKKGEKFTAVGFDTGYDDKVKWLVNAQSQWIRADLVTAQGQTTPPVNVPGAGLDIFARWSWTDVKSPRTQKLIPADTTKMILHYPGFEDKKPLAGLTKSQVATILESIRADHSSREDWNDIGYNYCVDGQGHVYELLGDVKGIHAPGYNETSIGVLLLLAAGENVPQATIDSVRALYELKAKTFALTEITGHGRLNSTSCPGIQIQATIDNGLFGPSISPEVPEVPEPVEPPVSNKPELDPDNYPSKANPKRGAEGAHITWLGKRLVAHGFDFHYRSGPGPNWGEADRKNLAEFQQFLGYSGTGADGYAGIQTLKALAAEPSGQSVSSLSWNLAAYDTKGKGERTRVSRIPQIAEQATAHNPLWIHFQECSKDMLAGMDKALHNYVRVPEGGKGRESYYRKNSGILILNAQLQNVKHMLAKDTKEFLVVAYSLNGVRAHETNFHNENEGTTYQLLQMRDVKAAAQAHAKKYKVTLGNLLLAGDSNRKQTIVDQITYWKDAGTAPITVNAEYHSTNSWKRSTKGRKIDVNLVPKKGGKFLRYQQDLSPVVSDHNPQWVVRRLTA